MGLAYILLFLRFRFFHMCISVFALVYVYVRVPYRHIELSYRQM